MGKAVLSVNPGIRFADPINITVLNYDADTLNPTVYPSVIFLQKLIFRYSLSPLFYAGFSNFKIKNVSRETFFKAFLEKQPIPPKL